MPSLISQMRNEPIMPRQQQQMPSQQLEQSIEDTRQLMKMIQTSQNPQLVFSTLIQQNPQLSKLVQAGNLQALAGQMARANGVDLNWLISQLGK